MHGNALLSRVNTRAKTNVLTVLINKCSFVKAGHDGCALYDDYQQNIKKTHFNRPDFPFGYFKTLLQSTSTVVVRGHGAPLATAGTCGTQDHARPWNGMLVRIMSWMSRSWTTDIDDSISSNQGLERSVKENIGWRKRGESELSQRGESELSQRGESELSQRRATVADGREQRNPPC